MFNLKCFTVRICLGIIIGIVIVLHLPSKADAWVVDGSFSLQPLYSPFGQGCVSSVDVIVNTGTNVSNAANVIIGYVPSQIEIIDANPSQDGTQIHIGTAYESYADNYVDTTWGVIRLTGFATNSGFSGQGVFATIKFRSKPGVTSSQLLFTFTLNNTLDSNIAEMNSSTDILGSVANQTFNFVPKNCPTDTEGPTITPVQPISFDTNVDLNSNVVVEVCDSGSGVDIRSVIITILGQEYSYLDSAYFTYAGDSSCYTIVVNPQDTFPKGEPVFILFKSSDLSGNTTTLSIIFNIPQGEDECIDLIREELDRLKEQCEKCETCEVPPPEKEVVYIEIPTELPITGGRKIALRIDLMKDVLSVSGFFNIITLLLATIALLLAYPSLFVKKVKKPWGLVYDKKSRKPVAFAVVRLYSEGKLIAEEVTDLEGRYGFPVEEGRYILEATAQGYNPYKTECDVSEDRHDVNRDIILQPKKEEFSAIKQWLSKVRTDARELFPKVSLIAFIVGFMIIFITTIINLSFLNLILLGLYIIMSIFHILTRTRTKNGTVYDSKTKEEIAYVAVRLYDAEQNKLIDNVMSTKDGKYMFIVTPKKYYLLASRSGYTFPSKTEKQNVKEVFYGSLIEVDVKKGNILAVDIAMDPADSSTQQMQTEIPNSYGTPFGGEQH